MSRRNTILLKCLESRSVIVRIKNYVITSDPLNWTLSEVKIYGEDSKHVGKEYTVVRGYYGSLDALVRAITDNEIKLAWESIQDIKTDVERTLKELINAED
jgi:hypothetical protein